METLNSGLINPSKEIVLFRLRKGRGLWVVTNPVGLKLNKKEILKQSLENSIKTYRSRLRTLYLLYRIGLYKLL
jgi:hypothetical protein